MSFWRRYGNKGPWTCAYCNRRITKGFALGGRDTLVIHHVDHDEKNNDPENLVPMHRECHIKHHHIGKKRTKADRAKQSATLQAKRERMKKLEAMAKELGI